MEVNPKESLDEIYRLLTSIIIPRPIGWVSTQSANGTSNLAPYSFFMGIIEDAPPLVMVSIEEKEPGQQKDTAINIRETGEFGLNLVTEELVEQMDRSSEPVDADIDEFEHVGLTKRKGVRIDAPLVAESKANMECTLFDTMSIGDHIVVFGRIINIHVDEELLTDGKIDVEKVNAVGRLTGSYYATLDPFKVTRDWQ